MATPTYFFRCQQLCPASWMTIDVALSILQGRGRLQMRALLRSIENCLREHQIASDNSRANHLYTVTRPLAALEQLPQTVRRNAFWSALLPDAETYLELLAAAKLGTNLQSLSSEGHSTILPGLACLSEGKATYRGTSKVYSRKWQHTVPALSLLATQPDTCFKVPKFHHYSKSPLSEIHQTGTTLPDSDNLVEWRSKRDNLNEDGGKYCATLSPDGAMSAHTNTVAVRERIKDVARGTQFLLTIADFPVTQLMKHRFLTR
ncbi:hypothetical protein JOM56_015269 [Amanita muscaria]